MRNYGRFREAVRRGIEAAGCHPVLVEDFPSLPVSPRSACLDAVRSCDVYVGVLGLRAGSEAPSGQTVVEEELREARTCGLPILLFIQEGDRESRQQAVVDRVSDFVEGRYRTSFEAPDELAREVKRSLEVLEPMVAEDPDATREWVSSRLSEGLFRDKNEPTLRMAVAPVRKEEVIDPREIEPAGRWILDLGHSDEIGLLSYGSGYNVDVQSESVVVRPVDQTGSGSPHSRAAVELDEYGRLFVEANIRDLRQREDRTFGLEILEEDVAVQVRRALLLTGGIYERVDEYGRHQHFIHQAMLRGIQYKQLVSEAESGRVGGRVPMGRGDKIMAPPDPRQLNRRVLTNPADEVERIMERFRRAMAE